MKCVNGHEHNKHSPCFECLQDRIRREFGPQAPDPRDAEIARLRAENARLTAYIDEQRASVTPTVEDFGTRIRELEAENERLRALATREVADAIVRSTERATRIYWHDYATGDACESGVGWSADEITAANGWCAFGRMLHAWWLQRENERLRALVPSGDTLTLIGVGIDRDEPPLSGACRAQVETWIGRVEAWDKARREASR